MWRLYEKWRLIIRLRDECVRHIGKPSEGFIPVNKWGTIMVVRGAFVQQTVSRFWWSKIWSEEHKKLHEINSILDSCIADNLVETLQRDDGKTLIKTSVKGEDSCGLWDLAEAILSRYRSVWTIVLIPLITLVAGVVWSSYIKNFLHKLFGG